MAIKFIHARMPGRELIHLVPVEGLSLDKRFSSEEFVAGKAMSLCGKRSSGWIVDAHGDKCEHCAEHR